ncbi:MAG: hypothetical protein Q9221_002064 [Calogaya cf. arnoldii]
MMSTDSALAIDPATREREIRHLELQSKGVPIPPHELPDNEDKDPSSPLMDDLEGDLGLAWELIKDVHVAEQRNRDASGQAETTEAINEHHDQDHHDDEAGQASPPASAAPKKADPETAKTPVLDITRTPDVVGISFLGTAIIYHYSPQLAHATETLLLWVSTSLPQPVTHQFRATIFFLLVPIWVNIYKAIKAILYWIFLAVENKRLDRKIKKCSEKILLLDASLAQSKEMLALQNKIIVLKEQQVELLKQQGDLLEPESAKKKKRLNKKKKNSGANEKGALEGKVDVES